jgi:hypothetical protein
MGEGRPRKTVSMKYDFASGFHTGRRWNTGLSTRVPCFCHDTKSATLNSVLVISAALTCGLLSLPLPSEPTRRPRELGTLVPFANGLHQFRHIGLHSSFRGDDSRAARHEEVCPQARRTLTRPPSWISHQQLDSEDGLHQRRWWLERRGGEVVATPWTPFVYYSTTFAACQYYVRPLRLGSGQASTRPERILPYTLRALRMRPATKSGLLPLRGV